MASNESVTTFIRHVIYPTVFVGLALYVFEIYASHVTRTVVLPADGWLSRSFENIANLITGRPPLPTVTETWPTAWETAIVVCIVILIFVLLWELTNDPRCVAVLLFAVPALFCTVVASSP